MFLIPCCKNLDHQSGSNITRQPETAMSAQMSHQHCVYQSGQTTVASVVPEGLARISGSIKETPCDRIQSGYGRQKAGFLNRPGGGNRRVKPLPAAELKT